MATPRRPGFATPHGFSVLELMFVCALTATLAGMAMLVTPAVLSRARSDSAASALVAILRTAREQSISFRRNVRVEFVEGNRVRVQRVEVPGPATTVLLDTRLEQSTQYVRFTGVSDTPDLFSPRTTAVDFGTAATLNFTSEGTFVDHNGDPLNGTVFIGLPNQRDTAQAVTIFGPTAYLRAWRWSGARWVE